MNTTQIRAVEAGIFFLCIFLSCFWLSRYQKPYPGIFFNIHKLIGLATLVFLGITFYRIRQTILLGPVEMIAVVITALFFVITIIAGGLLNVEKSLPAALAMIHKVFPYLTTLSGAVTLYLLLRQSWN